MATQVYYVEDPIDAEWATVIIPSYYDINETENIQPGSATLLDPCSSIRVSVVHGGIGSSRTDIDGIVLKSSDFNKKKKWQAEEEGIKKLSVTNEELAQVEYELQRNRNVEENEKMLALLRHKGVALIDVCEKSLPQNRKKGKAPSPALDNTAERRVLRSRGTKESGNANSADQPSKEITTNLVDVEKGGRTITKKANIYARMNKPKIKIPLNDYDQPIGPDE